MSEWPFHQTQNTGYQMRDLFIQEFIQEVQIIAPHSELPRAKSQVLRKPATHLPPLVYSTCFYFKEKGLQQQRKCLPINKDHRWVTK
jgi:hypothetical protein